MKKLLFLFGISIFSFVLKAQDMDQSLAIQFYQNQEYPKAAELFAKLYDKNPNDVNYHYLYNTYLQMKEYDKLEKILKKKIKKDQGNLLLLLDLGNLYKQKGDTKASEEQYNKAIKNIPPDEASVIALANAAMQMGDAELAIKVYQKGQDVLKNKTAFGLELANLYEKTGKKKEAVTAYLEHLEAVPSDEQLVKNRLQDAIQDDGYYQELQAVLLSKVQRQADQELYAGLLIWAYLQRSDYHNAFIQARALDKRNHENGFRLLNLARTALDDEAYAPAIEAYQYIIDKGKANSLYLPAVTELLKARKERITHDYNFTQGSVDTLLQQYNQFIADYGVNRNTIPTLLEKAELQALYIHQYDSAVATAESVVKLPQVDRGTKAKAKIALGDYYLLLGEDWEASLTYSQVDKEMREDPLGELARFKNAKLSYYQGDFEWSQAQLNILKASTTDFIANDALQLAVFMQDNLGMDSTLYPMQTFAKADLLVYQNKLDDALTTLDSITALYPTHPLADDILYEKAQIYLKKKNFIEAEKYLKQVIEKFGTDILADDATFTLASLYETQYHDKEKAKELYKSIITNYKDSIYVVEARKRFRKLRGDDVQP